MFKILKTIAGIIQGYFNYYFRFNFKVEQKAKERLLICASCPKLDLKGDKCIIKGTKPCCGECGCSIEKKIRNNIKRCPLKKW